MTTTTVSSTQRAAAAARIKPLRYAVSRMDVMRLLARDPRSTAFLGLTIALLRLFGRPAMFALSTLASASAVSLGMQGNDLWIYVAPFGLSFLVPVGGMSMVLWWWFARTYAPNGFDQARELTFGPDGMTDRRGPREHEIAWGAVRGAVELRGALLLHLSYREDLLIPKRAFEDEAQRRRLVEFLENHCNVAVTTPVADSAAEKPRYFPWENRAKRLAAWLLSGWLAILVIALVVILWN